MPLILILIITLLNFFIFRHAINFSLAGDDWLALYRFHTTFTSFLSYFDLRLYMGNYDIANIIVGVISKLFGFNPRPYFVAAVIFRTLAALSFYFPLKEIFKKKTLAALGVLVYTFSFSGSQSVDWVFNMNAYLSIFFANIFLTMWIKSFSSGKFLAVFPPAIFAFISFIFAPNRMHALSVILPALEIYRYAVTRERGIIFSLVRISILLLPILIFRKITAQSWDTTYLTMTEALFSQNFYKILSNLLYSFSSAFLPDSLLNPNASFIILIIILFFLVSALRKYTTYAVIGISAITCALLFEIAPWLVYSNSLFSSSNRYHVVTAGVLVFAFIAIIAVMLKKSGKISAYVFLGLLIISNFYASSEYLENLYENGRNAKEVEMIFSKIKEETFPLPNDKPSVFIFTSDNPQYLYNSVGFGFTLHMAFLYPNSLVTTHNLPFAVDSQESLIKILSEKDQSELRRYGFSDVDISLDRFYSFDVNKSSVTNTTEKTRNEIRSKLKRQVN